MDNRLPDWLLEFADECELDRNDKDRVFLEYAFDFDKQVQIDIARDKPQWKALIEKSRKFHIKGSQARTILKTTEKIKLMEQQAWKGIPYKDAVKTTALSGNLSEKTVRNCIQKKDYDRIKEESPFRQVRLSKQFLTSHLKNLETAK